MVFVANSTLITDVRRLQLFIHTNCNFIILCVSDLTELLYSICTILLRTYPGVLGLLMLLIALLH